MKYKMTQAFYMCPRGYGRTLKPSYYYKRKDFDYSRPKDTLQFKYGYKIPYYKYAGPKNVDKKIFAKENEHLCRAYVHEADYVSMTFINRTYRPLYKQKRLKKENGVVYIYTVPKTFSVENRYNQFRL